MSRITSSSVTSHPNATFDVILDLVADRVAAKLRPMLEGSRADDYVSRKTSGLPGRWWDRNAGVSFATTKVGRERRAKRADVLAAVARDATFKPEPEAIESTDDDIRAMAAIGIALGADR